MAKLNISFNNTNYNIDDSSLSAATAELQSHLSTTMNGTGATITLGGTSYNIDSAKLSTATNAFVSHLGMIAGSGSKVVVGGVEYGVDSTKMADAVAELESVFGDLVEQSAESGGVSLIDFTIDGTAYQAVDGMTWAEWCESDYNTGGFYVSSSSMVYLSETSLSYTYVHAGALGAGYVIPSELIISGNAYAIGTTSLEGGGAN